LGNIVEKPQILLDHSVVLFYLLTREYEGKSVPLYEAAPMVVQDGNAPVYGCLDSYLGYDIAGGRST